MIETIKVFQQLLKKIFSIFRRMWTPFWMRYTGLSPSGRIATRIATWFSPPYKARSYMARLNTQGYLSPTAVIHHGSLHFENNVFIGDRVVIYQAADGGSVNIGKNTHIHQDTVIETGAGGGLTIGADTHIQPRCQFSAYKSQIQIGNHVQIAPNCSFYPYDHGFKPGEPIHSQPLHTKGGIIVDDDAWLGVGVIVLDGVRIGKGSVVGAGSVVTHSIPDKTIAVGNPARVIKKRSEI